MAGTDGSIPPSVGSVTHQGSGSSSPCSQSSSGGSRHPVSALKKWLTNPVRKLSSDARGGVGKVEKQMCRSDRTQPPSLLSHNESQPRPLEPPDCRVISSGHDNYTILPSGDTVRPKNRQTDRQTIFIPPTFYIVVCDGVCVCVLYQCGHLSDLLLGRDTQKLSIISFFF